MRGSKTFHTSNTTQSKTIQASKRRFLLTALAAAPAAMMAPSLAAPALAKAAPLPAPARGPAPRITGSAEDQERAGIPGIPEARFAADRIEAFRAALGSAAILSDAPWLALSTGGENGAFGAGLINGWSEAGTRPAFAVVTGVSTGALIAPFAFLGPRWDGALRQAYTTITAADVFEFGATDMSLLDTWPLAKLIARFVTPDLLAAIAVEHAAGRRLFIVTTNLDSGRPVAWNMGAIATKSAVGQGDANAVKLFRDILLASGAIPGLFPPVTFDLQVDGRAIQELHADGGINTPFYVAPEALVAAGPGSVPAAIRLPAREIYVIVNNRLEPEFNPVQRNLMSVLGSALSPAVKAGTRAALRIHAGFARDNGIALHVAAIDANYVAPSNALFDPTAMQTLYAYAQRRARADEAFDTKPALRLSSRI